MPPQPPPTQNPNRPDTPDPARRHLQRLLNGRSWCGRDDLVVKVTSPRRCPEKALIMELLSLLTRIENRHPVSPIGTTKVEYLIAPGSLSERCS
jgi:hypothetical protein